MGSPTILYCGADECLRMAVLRVAGFRVAHCPSVADLAGWLQDEPEMAAVLFEEAHARPADAGARLVRQCSTAAPVLFRHPAGQSRESSFDLVIEPATPPMRWLQQVAETVLARAGLAPGWARIARQLQARSQDFPPDPENPVRGFGIQPVKRRCT